MSAFSLLALGSRAVNAAYTQLQATGNNIANANIKGYSRQQVQLATNSAELTGSGYLGRGVTVTTIARASNQFMAQQVVHTASAAAADAARRDRLSQLEKVFAGGETGLGHAATRIFNSFADLAAAPTDLAARQTVLARLEDFASLSRSTSAQIEALQGSVAHDVRGAVTEVNAMTKALAKLNVSIQKAGAEGHSPNDLLDQRDQLIQRLGEKLQLQIYYGADDTANLFVGSGQSLVVGSQAFAVMATDSPDDPGRVRISIDQGGLSAEMSLQDVGEGQIGGLLDVQNGALAEARNRLGQWVAGLTGAVNQQQGFGLDLQGQAGAPLFGHSAPQAVPAQGNRQDAGGHYLATVSLAVTDPARLQASDYRLAPDPAQPGQYIVTRLADGQVFQPVADGDTLDGFAITIGPTAPQAGESFRLKPVAGAAGDLQVLLKNPRGVAAASPVTALAAVTNTGTASVRSGAIVAAPALAYRPLTLRFTDDQGAYEIVDAGNAVQASGTFVAGRPIAYDGIALSLSGLARSGDQVQLAPTAHPAASNGNAVRFDDMARLGLIDGATVTDAHANTLSMLGVYYQGARSAAETSQAVAGRAAEDLSSQVGVNLDEEAARLIQYQQAYQASAKVLQSAQAILDTLLNIGR